MSLPFLVADNTYWHYSEIFDGSFVTAIHVNAQAYTYSYKHARTHRYIHTHVYTKHILSEMFHSGRLLHRETTTAGMLYKFLAFLFFSIKYFIGS